MIESLCKSFRMSICVFVDTQILMHLCIYGQMFFKQPTLRLHDLCLCKVISFWLGHSPYSTKLCQTPDSAGVGTSFNMYLDMTRCWAEFETYDIRLRSC